VMPRELADLCLMTKCSLNETRYSLNETECSLNGDPLLTCSAS